MSDSLGPHGLYSPWNSPGQNTGVGSLSFLQGNLPSPGIEPRSPTLQADSLPAEPQGKPFFTPNLVYFGLPLLFLIKLMKRLCIHYQSLQKSSFAFIYTFYSFSFLFHNFPSVGTKHASAHQSPFLFLAMNLKSAAKCK